MEEIITIDEIQYKLTYDQPLTTEQMMQTISDIKRQSVVKTLINTSDAIRNGADRLVQTQNNDGTWEWSDPDIDPTTTQYPGINNILGITARGLVNAYSVTIDVNYLNAAKKTADLLVSKTPDGFGPDDPGTIGKHKVYAQDIIFLVEFANAWAHAGNDASTYYAKANDYMTVILNNPNRFCTTGCFGNESTLVQYYFNYRQPNLYGWDLAAWVEAAVKTGHMDFAQDIVSNMAQYSSYLSSTATGTYPQGFSYVLGLSGYLQSYILTCANYSAIESQLLSELNTDGSFKIYAGTDDGINQTTAYALMALSLTNVDMTGTISYLTSPQPIGGKWIENDGHEYTEVDSEVVTALAQTMTTIIPANVISTILTIDTIDCIEPCTVNGTVSWTNNGGSPGCLDPVILVNTVPTSIGPIVPINIGETLSYTFSILGLMAGTHVVQASPNTGTVPRTITVTTPANVISATLTVDTNDCVAPCTVNGTVSWTNTGGTVSSPIDISITVDGVPTLIDSAVAILPGETTAVYPFTIHNLAAGTYTVQASPNTGTSPQTITVRTPANIVVTVITPSVTTCVEPCDLTVSVTWTNSGETSGTFIPTIDIDNIPISPAQYPSELLNPGISVDHIFTVTGLMKGLHTICANPGTTTDCVTITIGQVAKAGMDATRMIVVAGLAIGAILAAGKP